MNAFEKLITATGMGYKDFSKLARVDERHIRYIRAGQRVPSTAVVQRLAKALKVPRGELFEILLSIRKRKAK